MKIDINDPRITAFALGELQGSDATEMARAVQADARVRAAVDEVRGTSFVLMESLSGEAHMLTAAQRKTVRSAGGGSVITDMASARVPFWKKPWVAGIGVAAAVAMTFYMVTDHSGRGGDGGQGVAGADADHLPVPVHVDLFKTTSPDASLRGNDWQNVVADTFLTVPTRSGRGSWETLVNSIEKKQTLPAKTGIHVEELLNHFQYKMPGMQSLVAPKGLGADMELCVHPWNPDALLLAVHIAAQPGVDFSKSKVRLNFDADVKRVRLLGYTRLQGGNPSSSSMVSGVDSSGESEVVDNYVLYELEPVQARQGGGAFVKLAFDNGLISLSSQAVRWDQASQDMRFASVIAAAGMMVTGDDSAGGLTSKKVTDLLRMIEDQDGSLLSSDRRSALKVIKKIIDLKVDQNL